MSNESRYKLVIYATRPIRGEEKPRFEIGCDSCPVKTPDMFCGGAAEKSFGTVPPSEPQILGVALLTLSEIFVNEHFPGHKGSPPLISQSLMN